MGSFNPLVFSKIGVRTRECQHFGKRKEFTHIKVDFFVCLVFYSIIQNEFFVNLCWTILILKFYFDVCFKKYFMTSLDIISP